MMHFAPCTFTCSCLTMNILWRPPMVYISMTSLHNVIKLKSDWRIQKCNASFELILIPFYLCRNAQFLTESSQKSNNWTYGSLGSFHWQITSNEICTCSSLSHTCAILMTQPTLPNFLQRTALKAAAQSLWLLRQQSVTTAVCSCQAARKCVKV